MGYASDDGKLNIENKTLDFVRLSFENDVFFHEDGGYSNGLFVSWGYNSVSILDRQTLPAWIACLMLDCWPEMGN